MGALAIKSHKELKLAGHVYCSFLLGDFEVVLPVEMIQEVVNYPEIVTKMPLSPDFIEGVFSLRGLVIPIANMHLLLKTSGDISPKSKIVIVHLRGIRIGLVFDSTSEILKVSEDKICKFDYADKKNGVVCGALKLDDGRRILQIIDPEALIGQDRIPLIVEKLKLAGQSVEDDNLHKNKKRKQCISFICHNVSMAFEMDDIHEILKFQKLEPGFVNYDYSLGLLGLRGSMIPIVHFSQFLDSEAQREGEYEHKKIVVIKTKNNHKLGLLVDSVEDIISYFENDLLPIPLIGAQKKDFYSSLISKDGKEVILLNNKVFMEHPEITHIVEGHATLFKEDENKKVVKKKLEKQVFISFKIEAGFSLPINDIREIVNYPEHVIAPPGAKNYIAGLFNLREKVVTIVDMRKFYGIDPSENMQECKVLVVENNKDSYGLVVDMIDQIFSVNVDEKFPIPTHLTTKTEKKLGQDMKELVMICDKKNETDTKLIVLDLSKILKRVSLE